jgi:glycosyltransferase involved in cell wall biosynthesis
MGSNTFAIIMKNSNCYLYPSPPVSAIIPAYNEAGRIGGVLSVLHQADLINEIIVVDDGSQDKTSDEVLQAASLDPRIRLLRNATNQGKGGSILSALRKTQSPYLLLFDADLRNLTKQHVYDLIQPLLRCQADMTVGIFRRGHFLTDLGHWLTPWLSGQRCLRADLLRLISPTAARGYGIETALTVASHLNSARCVYIPLHGVWHPQSELHRGYWPGLWLRLRMYGQIIRAWHNSGGWKLLMPHYRRRPRRRPIIT